MEDNNNHPNYVLVWVALAVLTAVEVGITYLSWSKTTLIVVLVGLAVWKAVLVAMYFMHLKFDDPLLSRIFMAGIFIALAVFGVMLFSLNFFVNSGLSDDYPENLRLVNPDVAAEAD